MWLYHALVYLLRAVVQVFFRQIEVVGHSNIPAEGAGSVIFAGNHPNSLIDPVMIFATARRVVHVAAKDVLFRSRLTSALFRALGAVPIRRASDHADGAGKVDNSAAFDALIAVLAQGRAVGIFPEGISHDRSQLARLKTGAARIALGVAGQHPDLPLQIIPCGLTYIRRKRFRGRVLVQYGEPISIGPELLELAAADSRQAARQLTEQIDAGIRALTINVSDWDTLRVLDGVRRLYQPPKIPLAHRVELARRFCLVYEEVKQEPRVQQLYARVKQYIDRLDDIGLKDSQLRHRLRPAAMVTKFIRQLVWTFLWLPLAGPGVIIHAPIGLLAGWGGYRFTPRKDVMATSKLLAGVGLVALIYAALVAAATWLGSWVTGLTALALLPLTGHATLRVMARAHSARRLLMRVVRTFRWQREVRQLRQVRAALERDVVRAVEQFKPQEMVALYPRDGADHEDTK